MSNIAVIFAGGTGQRMNTRTKPKQFLELHGKPVLVYTLEQFQQHNMIDGIVLVMLESWIGHCWELVKLYGLDKVVAIVPGGETCQTSIFCGLSKAGELYDEDSIALIHDGVRPLIDGETITRAIACAREHGSAITVSPAVETIAVQDGEGVVGQIIDRSKCQLAKAPQCFRLGDILGAHRRAREEGKTDYIDSASLMRSFGHTLYTVEGTPENIKITTPGDFYIFRAIMDARENSQILGF